ncbi:MAG: methyltransferase domain-containing protein [Emcibacter sp.]|nr:methyltransferase domain-containing protein [Emcibacter sp.]
MLFTRINDCRLCGGSDLIEFFDLGEHSLSGCFPGPDAPDPQTAPLVLCRCSQCHLVQLGHDTNLQEMFTYDYGYRSALNASMCRHLSELVGWATAHCPLGNDDIVVDIGANDGTLLSNHAASGVKRIAIDPIIGKFRDDYPDDIECHEGFFSLENAQQYLGEHKAKLITSISMFYDLPDPSDFVAGITHILAPEGVWVLEQSYLPLMLEHNAFDTICHEHLEYYALSQIERLADHAGLKVIDVELNDCNGGSFRVAVAHKDSHHAVRSANIDVLRQQETALKLDSTVPYDAFLERVEDIGRDINDFLRQAENEGKSVYLYGASTKGNTLLQHYGIDTGKVTAALEVNPEKFGHRTPGTNIPIIDEASIGDAVPDYLLVLPWHFKSNILANGGELMAKGAKFVFPLPNLEIVGKDDI